MKEPEKYKVGRIMVNIVRKFDIFTIFFYSSSLMIEIELVKYIRLKSSYLPIKLNNSGLLLLLKLTFRIYSLIDMGVLESCLRLFEKHRPN